MRIVGARLLHLVAVLFLVSVSSLLLVDISKGDPALNLLGPTATDEQIAVVRHELNLDRSLPVRYGKWVGNALRGDLGRSYLTKLPVSTEIKKRIPVNLELAVLALALSLVIAIPLGALLAYKRDQLIDRIAGGVTSVMLSSPSFLTASLLVYFVAVKARWLPVSGWTPISKGLLGHDGNLRRIALPVISLAVVEIAQFSRLLRADMVDTLDQDHILAAKSIGLPSRKILFRYAFRPSSFSLLTVASIALGRLIGGSVIMELIFSLPGLGTLVTRAVTGKDILVVQGVTLFVGTIYVVVNVFQTVLYAWLDPRIRTARRG